MRYMLPAIVSIGLSGAFVQGPDTIRVFAVALDSSTGRPVHRLGADAFQVTVDGSPAAFQAREVAHSPEDGSTSVSRTLIFAIDDYAIAKAQGGAVHELVRRVAEQLAPGVALRIETTSGGIHFGPTTDLTALLVASEKVTGSTLSARNRELMSPHSRPEGDEMGSWLALMAAVDEDKEYSRLMQIAKSVTGRTSVVWITGPSQAMI